MSNEATIQSTLSITKGNLAYRTAQGSFRADVSTARGPSPGAITVSTSGTDVSFAELTSPGLCYVKNLDDTNFVEYGPRDPDSGLFLYFGKLLPGEGFVFRLSHNLGMETTGTGTVAGGNATLRMIARGASCVVLVDAFEE